MSCSDRQICPSSNIFSAAKNVLLDVLSSQPHLTDLADFCRLQLGWDDDAIIDKMRGSVWEGACLRTTCKVGGTCGSFFKPLTHVLVAPSPGVQNHFSCNVDGIAA
jgi:hypothetical protein